MSLGGPRYVVVRIWAKHGDWLCQHGWHVRDLHTREDHPCGSRNAAVDRAVNLNRAWGPTRSCGGSE